MKGAAPYEEDHDELCELLDDQHPAGLGVRAGTERAGSTVSSLDKPSSMTRVERPTVLLTECSPLLNARLAPPEAYPRP